MSRLHAGTTTTAIVSDALDQPVLYAAPELCCPAEEFSDGAQDNDWCGSADDGSGPGIGAVPLPSIPEVPVGDEEKGEPVGHDGGPADNRLLSDGAEIPPISSTHRGDGVARSMRRAAVDDSEDVGQNSQGGQAELLAAILSSR